MSIGRAVLKTLLLRDNNISSPVACSDVLVNQLIEHGLGPAAYDANCRHKLITTDDASNSLLAADLTARAITASRIDAIEAVLHAFSSSDIRSVLLKGAAIAPRYPQPHWRIMSDVDILVEKHRLTDSVSILRILGFTKAYPDPESHWHSHHHVAPMIHPRQQLCIELHHALDSSSWFCTEELSAEQVWRQITPNNDFSSLTHSLSPRLQLHHMAAHWYLHLIENAESYGGHRALFDVALLLQGKTIDIGYFPSTKRLSFATLTIMLILRRLGAVQLPESVVNAVISDQNLEETILDFNTRLISRRLFALVDFPTTLTHMIESDWIKTALVTDDRSLFHTKRFIRAGFLIRDAACHHSRSTAQRIWRKTEQEN